jgi:hypothetical protein
MEDRIDPELLLGNMALKAGFVTPEQLRTALGDQARDLEEGRTPRQLGLIFLARGWLSEDQVVGLLREQAERRAKQKSGGGPTSLPR